MNDENLSKAFAILQEIKGQWQDNTINSLGNDPFLVLVSGILSHRTKDQVTKEATRRLLEVAPTPEGILKIPEEELSRIIYPVGFYRRKAKTLRKTAEILLTRYQGKVPDDLEELLKLPGVGRKTANLVLTMGFQKPAISVDTHIHRIVNRWGYVETKTPEETEKALREKLPLPYWEIINPLLVLFGQNICLPRRPRCSHCPVEEFCEKRGVEN